MANSSVPRHLLAGMGFETYSDYLKSDHWQDVRRRYFTSKLPRRRHGRCCCEACGTDKAPLSLHHKTYKRFGAEWLTDLILMCQPCHEKTHELHRNSQAKNGRAGLWAAHKALKRAAKKAGTY